MKDWHRRRGESLADYAVRLYTSNANVHVPHIENCNRLLRVVTEFITLRIVHKTKQRLTIRHFMRVESFLGLMMQFVPEKTWQEDIYEMLIGWEDTSYAKDELGRKAYPQMDESIKFYIIRFIESIKSMKYGDVCFTDDELLEETVVNDVLSHCAKSPYLTLSSYSASNLVLVLHTLASDVLTAHVLPIKVRRHINQLVSDFRKQCRFWHSPVKDTITFLRPLIRNLLHWLRSNMESLQLACANESVLYCVEYNVRCMLKRQVYESHQNFMDVLHSVKDSLTNIELPSNAIHLLQLDKEVHELEDANNFVRTQIIKDLNRDCVMLNGVQTNVNEAMNELKHLITKAQPRKLLTDAAGMDELLYLSKCSWHILHAASRTACSGDSYLIVSDLFGGKGVSVNAPSHIPPIPICIKTRGLLFEVFIIIYFFPFLFMIVPVTRLSSLSDLVVTSNPQPMIDFNFSVIQYLSL